MVGLVNPWPGHLESSKGPPQTGPAILTCQILWTWGTFAHALRGRLGVARNGALWRGARGCSADESRGRFNHAWREHVR
jgi:hypothetical protein